MTRTYSNSHRVIEVAPACGDFLVEHDTQEVRQASVQRAGDGYIRNNSTQPVMGPPIQAPATNNRIQQIIGN